MKLGGLQKFTLLDYPGHIAAIVFTVGCNFRCRFCYNPMLVWPHETGKAVLPKSSGHASLDEDGLLAFLRERRGKLDGVVITGGEPTLHADLPAMLGRIRVFGYDIKLDTNGTNPEMLSRLAADGLVHYIAMDIKAPLDRYEETVGVKTGINQIKESIGTIMASGLPYEFRTTVVPELFAPADADAIGRLIQGADKWFLQSFKSDTDLVDTGYKGKASYTNAEMETICKIGAKYVKMCAVR